MGCKIVPSTQLDLRDDQRDKRLLRVRYSYQYPSTDVLGCWSVRQSRFVLRRCRTGLSRRRRVARARDARNN
ncbi:MAG: hypothetical protein VST64_06695, partial [Nitrospirota bacterium]|nr:hypothetical protein [Nitrospirota bacterium]